MFQLLPRKSLYDYNAPPNSAKFLGIVGQILVGIYLLSVLPISLPIAFMDSEWQLRTAKAIQNSAGFPLVGTGLLLVARKFAPTDHVLRNRLSIVSRLAPWIAIGFLLLIPLQVNASIRNLAHTSRNEQRDLRNLINTIKAIETADDEFALRSAIARLPGAPQQLNGNIQGSVQEIRSKLAAELRPQAQALETQLREADRLRWFDTLKNWMRDLPSCLLYAIGFVAISNNRKLSKIYAFLEKIT
ncbi:MAG: HpsJ family protein [Cyanobium sp.]